MEKGGEGGRRKKSVNSIPCKCIIHRGRIEERNWLVRDRKHLYSVNIFSVSGEKEKKARDVSFIQRAHECVYMRGKKKRKSKVVNHWRDGP